MLSVSVLLCKDSKQQSDVLTVRHIKPWHVCRSSTDARHSEKATYAFWLVAALQKQLAAASCRCSQT